MIKVEVQELDGSKEVTIRRSDDSFGISQPYDGNGRLQEQSIYERDRFATKSSLKLDGCGNVLRRCIFTYDENDHMVSAELYDGDGKCIEIWKYTNDDKGRAFPTQLYDGQNNLRYSCKNTYKDYDTYDIAEMTCVDSEGKVVSLKTHSLWEE